MAQRFKAKTLLANSGIFNNEVIAPNLTYSTGDQTISGNKTFSDNILIKNNNQIVGFLSGSSNGEDVNNLTLKVYPMDSQEGYLNLDYGMNDVFPISRIRIGEEGVVLTAEEVNINATNLIRLASDVNNINSAIYLDGRTQGNTGTFTKLLANNLVYNTGNQNISGIKNFITRPTINGVEVLVSGDSVNAVIPSTVVRTTGAQTIGGLKIFSSGLISNVGITGTNLVYNTGNQSIGGLKTFSNGLISNVGITGTNLVYNTGSQTISGVKTFDASTIFSNGLTSTTSITVPNVVYNTGSQIVSGVKNFDQRPTVNGTGILLSGEAVKGFTGDLRVSLSGNKTFGRYFNGETIPASGKTITEVLELALIEPIIPTVNFNSSSAIIFNQTEINNTLNASYTINSLKSPYSSTKASIKTGYIEWKRSNAINWNVLTINTAPSFSYTHTLTDTQFNSNGFNYRYIVTDDLNATNTEVINISPSPYIAPTLSNISVGVSPADLGNVNVSLFAVINKNSSNVDFVSYLPQYHTGNNNWTNIGSSVFLPNASFEFSLTHNNLSLVNATGISYRLQVVDQYQTTGLLLGTRSFLYRNYFGYSTNTSLTLAQIQALSNNVLSNSKSRTISSVTAAAGNYTYYCYRADEGDLTSIILDGSSPIIGAFTKLSDVAGTNTYGASVIYRVYRSNATNAFTNNTLVFT